MAAAEAKRREERVKLFAGALSNTGVATVVASVIAPLAAGRSQLATASLGFVAGVTLHLAGQLVLHYVIRREPDEPPEVTA
jgi:hypothetical protein